MRTLKPAASLSIPYPGEATECPGCLPAWTRSLGKIRQSEASACPTPVSKVTLYSDLVLLMSMQTGWCSTKDWNFVELDLRMFALVIQKHVTLVVFHHLIHSSLI